MSDQTNYVNSDQDFDEISLDQNDDTLHYTIVPNSLIRNESISPECRWLIIFLISNKPGWKIKSKQIWEHTKGFIGRDKVLKIISEAIEAGYMLRYQITRTVNGKCLRGFTYKVASTPKFKKRLQQPDFQDPENQVTEIQEPEIQGPEGKGSKELLSKELLSKEYISSLKVSSQRKAEVQEKAAKADKLAKASEERKDTFSKEVIETGKEMIESMKEVKPDYKAPKVLTQLMTSIDHLIRIDKRSTDKILKVFRWALADPFWSDKFFKPNPAKYLREKFDQLEMKMNAKPQEFQRPRRFAEYSDEAKLKKMADELMDGAI